MSSTRAWSAQDSRFFGQYCGSDDVTLCARVCFFLCWMECETFHVSDFRAKVDYSEERPGFGTIKGTGGGMLDGDRLVTNFGGSVTSRGNVKGTVVSNHFDAQSGAAQLSSDGLTLSVSIRDQKLQLRKDACGNDPPSVELIAPADGAVLTQGRMTKVAGRVTTDEDAAFPAHRLMLTSNRDGPLVGSSTATARQITVLTDALSLGEHLLSFAATDSGGLTSTHSVRVQVAEPLRYAAKVVCGNAPRGLLAPGRYFSAINIQNPGPSTVRFGRSLSFALPGKSGDIRTLKDFSLEPASSAEVDCEEIVQHFPEQGGFFKGFLTLLSAAPLDVVAVYTVAGGGASDIDVEYVSGVRTPGGRPDLMGVFGCQRTVTVFNGGDAGAPASSTRIVHGKQALEISTPALAAGQRVELSIPVDFKLAGNYRLGIAVDSRNEISEREELNNISTVACH